MKSIVLITTGQPSTNPRIIKEYRSLKKKGYNVKVIYSYWTDWALKTDEEYFTSGELAKDDFLLTGGSPYKKKYIYLLTRAFHKFFKIIASFIPAFTKWTIARPSYSLYLKAISIKADLYIAHNLGALPAAYLAAKKNKSKVGFDAEDFHRGEFENKSSKQFSYTAYVENKYLPFTNYTTAAAPLIANAYELLYPDLKIDVLNNVFSKRFIQPVQNKNEHIISLFWFSQTIGSNRGLEGVIEAINMIKKKFTVELYLAGDISIDFKKKLLGEKNINNFIYFLGIIQPEKIFSIAAKYDIGLAVEVAHSDNRNFCLTNKLFTYLLAGNCIIATNTKAQEFFLKENSSIGFLYNPAKPAELAEILVKLNDDRNLLSQKRRASYNLALKTYNWEAEEKIFSSVITNTLKKISDN